jgi:hypothetical protein
MAELVGSKHMAVCVSYEEEDTWQNLLVVNTWQCVCHMRRRIHGRTSW